jgi:hypothetical protein
LGRGAWFEVTRDEVLDRLLREFQAKAFGEYRRGPIGPWTVCLGMLEVGALLGSRDPVIGRALAERILHHAGRSFAEAGRPTTDLAATIERRDGYLDEVIRAWDLAGSEASA